MLRSVLEDITVELKLISCVHFDSERSYLYLGMKTGEIVVLKVTKIEGKWTVQPSLFLSPGFENDSAHVVAITVAEMPFCLLTVGLFHTRTATIWP